MSTGFFDRFEELESLDAGVRLRLAESLDYLFESTDGRLGVDPERRAEALGAIRGSRQHPGVFARYYELVFALEEGNIVLARELAQEILRLSQEPVSFAVEPYAPLALGREYELYAKLMFAEYADACPMAPVPETAFAAHAASLESALAVIKKVDPPLSAEIEALFLRIYVAGGSDVPAARSFAGVTSFMAWGATFMNADGHRAPWQAVLFLVHEVTHALLFALGAHEALVRNLVADRFKSPLRPDPRPMDGIFHATIVCARIAAFAGRWLKADLLDGDERNSVERSADRHARGFRDGCDVIVRHGELSPRAQALLERAAGSLASAQ